MMKLPDLLDAAKIGAGAGSDAALARALGVVPSSISNWRTGVSLPDTVACGKLADLAGIPLAKVLGQIGELRAISRDEKAVWRRLASAAAVVLALVAGNAPRPASAAQGWADTSHNVYSRAVAWCIRAIRRARRVKDLQAGCAIAAQH